MKYKIREELLHYIWQVHAFDLNHLKTESGEEIEIISRGIANHDAGPDFLNGKIRIGDTIWAGHIELHLRSSDWKRHDHSPDPQYQNVILHVVYHADIPIQRKNKIPIPCLSLESRIHPSLLKTYEHLMNNQKWVPCEEHLEEINELTIHSTIEKMLASRLDQKASDLESQLQELNGDISLLIQQQLAWSLGLRVNGEAMKTLMQSIPFHAIQKHRSQLFQLEALLFGQSGLLPEEDDDDYITTLKREYEFLKTKFSLTPMPATYWKFHRLRPAAFPTIRIAQFAKILHTVDRLDLLLLEGKPEQIRKALTIQIDGYWKYHYTWNSPSAPRAKSIGKSKQDIILINAVVPVLWFYGTYRQQEALKDKALNILESISPEHNSIITKWKGLGINSTTAFDTQGLLQLKKHFCNHQKCLSCPIGHHLLSKSN